MIVFTREEFCDNDGVELAVESLNEGHNLSTPGTDKLEEWRKKKVKMQYEDDTIGVGRSTAQ